MLINLETKLLARLLSGLSCGQSRPLARTVFIQDVVHNAKTIYARKILNIEDYASNPNYYIFNPDWNCDAYKDFSEFKILGY